MKLAIIGSDLRLLSHKRLYQLYEAQTKNTPKIAQEATHFCATFFIMKTTVVSISYWLKIQADIPADVNQRKGMAEPFQIEIHVGPILIPIQSINLKMSI